MVHKAWLLVAALGVTGLGACESTLPPWEKDLPTTASLYQAKRGLRTVRGPIHIHTPYSHDACDGMPLPNGVPDAQCLADFRAGICRTHQDFAMITDHADFVSATPWDALFLPGEGDEQIIDDGVHIASKLACPDGTSVLVTIGSENDLMPIGLHSPVAVTPTDQGNILRGTDGATAAIFRAHGALVAIAHGESHEVAQIMDVQPDVLEIYNVHANLGPDIRLMMGLDPLLPINNLLPFITGEDTQVEPDMAMLAFWEENEMELSKLNAMWAAGKRVIATVGVDAHENVIPGKLQDGERGDGYRRLLRWFSNHLLVKDLTPQGLNDAITAGRAYAVFEIFGPATSFDFRAETSVGASDIGAELKTTDNATLVLDPPVVENISGRDVRTRILRVDSTGTSSEVASGSGSSPLSFVATAPGAYRAEVRVTPNALRHLMGKETSFDHEFVWIYTSPIYVR